MEDPERYIAKSEPTAFLYLVPKYLYPTFRIWNKKLGYIDYILYISIYRLGSWVRSSAPPSPRVCADKTSSGVHLVSRGSSTML